MTGERIIVIRLIADRRDSALWITHWLTYLRTSQELDLGPRGTGGLKRRKPCKKKRSFSPTKLPGRRLNNDVAFGTWLFIVSCFLIVKCKEFFFIKMDKVKFWKTFLSWPKVDLKLTWNRTKMLRCHKLQGNRAHSTFFGLWHALYLRNLKNISMTAFTWNFWKAPGEFSPTDLLSLSGIFAALLSFGVTAFDVFFLYFRPFWLARYSRKVLKNFLNLCRFFFGFQIFGELLWSEWVVSYFFLIF